MSGNDLLVTEIRLLRIALHVVQGWAGPRGDDDARRATWADNLDRIYDCAGKALNGTE